MMKSTHRYWARRPGAADGTQQRDLSGKGAWSFPQKRRRHREGFNDLASAALLRRRHHRTHTPTNATAVRESPHEDERHPLRHHRLVRDGPHRALRRGRQGLLAHAAFGDIRVRMVEYTPGYVSDHWCVKGHVLLCLQGELHTELRRRPRASRCEPGMSYQVADSAEAAPLHVAARRHAVHRRLTRSLFEPSQVTHAQATYVTITHWRLSWPRNVVIYR